nr:unnamed protein product [Callosobruchus chinensis]
MANEETRRNLPGSFRSGLCYVFWSAGSR